MRLTDLEIEVIEKAIYSLDQDAEIYLFGSRADDSRKGGDIDLLIISKNLRFRDKIKIRKRIFDDIDEQKIDLIIAKDYSDPFVRLALEQGVRFE
jgi:predicted nucleotidyltransferase